MKYTVQNMFWSLLVWVCCHFGPLCSLQMSIYPINFESKPNVPIPSIFVKSFPLTSLYHYPFLKHVYPA